MTVIIVILFIVGYAAITLEHNMGVNKVAIALITVVAGKHIGHPALIRRYKKYIEI